MYDPLECVIVEDKLVKNVLYKVLRVGFHKVYLKKKSIYFLTFEMIPY